LSGNYFTTLQNELQIKIIEHVPQFSFDMFGSIIEQILTEFAKNTEQALIIELEFTFEPVKLKGYFLLLLRIEELKAILGE